MVEWQWAKFEDLSTLDLYEIMKVRQEVFVVEQNCVYQDADDLDKIAWHLVGWRHATDGAERKIVAYLRVVYPGGKYTEPSIGRVLTLSSERGTGLGRMLTAEAIERISTEYPRESIRISAQQYLEGFYTNFGFKSASEPYEEDGIAHIEMVRD